MYGWRGKIGIMIPSVNITMEPELWKMAPKGVGIYTSRMLAQGCSVEDLKKQDTYVESCAEELATAEPDIILFGCTSGSFLGGVQWENEIKQRITKISHCPSITTTGAVLEAMKVLHKKNITIVSPYTEEVAQLEAKFFTEKGYRIVSEKNMGFDTGKDIYSQSQETVYRFAKSAVTKETELLFISCTNFPSFAVSKQLEKDLNITVITSNQCSLWAALRKINIYDKSKDNGILFQY